MSPPQFQVSYLLETNFQARLVERLLHLGAEDLVQGREVRICRRRHVLNLNLI
jgi:hypothetical protein